MIELAPQHKVGLPLKQPLMPAAGFWGYGGPVYQMLINAAHFGAWVTNPITLRPLPHQASPAVVESGAGIVMNTPPRNPGVKRVIRDQRKHWRQTPVPVIAHLPADVPADLRRTARALASLDTVAAFELAIPEAATPQDVRVWVEAIRSDSELPLLVKLPLPDPLPLAEAALSRGADALVLGMPPIGAAYSQDKRLITGDYFGMGVVAQRLPVIAQCKQEFPVVPLIASGSVHTAADAEAYLAAGAQAVQLDVIIFIDPQRAQKIIEKTATDGVG